MLGTSRWCGNDAGTVHKPPGLADSQTLLKTERGCRLPTARRCLALVAHVWHSVNNWSMLQIGRRDMPVGSQGHLGPCTPVSFSRLLFVSGHLELSERAGVRFFRLRRSTPRSGGNLFSWILRHIRLPIINVWNGSAVTRLQSFLCWSTRLCRRAQLRWGGGT